MWHVMGLLKYSITLRYPLQALQMIQFSILLYFYFSPLDPTDFLFLFLGKSRDLMYITLPSFYPSLI